MAVGRERLAAIVSARRGESALSIQGDAAPFYQPGDCLFACAPDGGDMQHLGAATALNDTNVEFSAALSADLGGGTLWRAVNTFVVPTIPSAPVERRYESGLAIERSIGGIVYSTRIAAPWRIDLLRFQQITRAAWQQWREWMRVYLANGARTFTWVDESGLVCRAQLNKPEITTHAASELFIDVALEIAILAEGEYAQ